MNYAARTVLCVLYVLLFTGTYCLAGQDAVAAPVADYVFKNGKIYTLDASRPWAESVAVKGNKIVYVGLNSDVKDWTGPETRVVDLNGRMLMPGFIDGHNHFVSGAAGKRGVKLVGSKDTQELLQRIRDYVKANPHRTAYTGFGWEFPMFGEKGGTRQELDSVCSDKPMIFFNEDMHHVWFNTKAMEVAGITKDTPDPVPGASFYKRGLDGVPSGIGIEPESWKVMAIATEIVGGKEMLQEIVDDVFPLLPKLGITAYHDMGMWGPDLPQGYLGFELLLDLEKSGKLPCRVVGVYGIRDGKASPDEHIQAMKEWSIKYRSDMVQVTGLKIWADGTFLSHTGVQIEPYADKSDTRGESNWTTDVLTRWIEAACASGFDVNIHTDGDLTVRRCLDAVDLVSKKLGPSERLTTLHHLTTIHPDDLRRFKALGVGANMTAVWLVNYKSQYEEAIRILGKDKVEKEFGLAKPLMEEGVNVTFGSDIPGTDPEESSPLFQIQAAVTGRVPGSTTTVMPPANRLPSLDQMIYGYTLAGARQMRKANEIGSIEAGKLADLIVLEKNLFDIPPNELSGVRALFTMTNGKVVFEDSSFK
ncbi:MAG: amidohydrolase [Thermodesulfobacteriota bacterium]